MSQYFVEPIIGDMPGELCELESTHVIDVITGTVNKFAPLVVSWTADYFLVPEQQ